MGTPRPFTAVSEGTMDATATPATSDPPSCAVTCAYAFRGPFRHAFLASCRNTSGSGATMLWGTRLRATTWPFSSTASAFTEVVPMSTPTVTGLRGGLMNLTRVS